MMSKSRKSLIALVMLVGVGSMILSGCQTTRGKTGCGPGCKKACCAQKTSCGLGCTKPCCTKY